MHTTFHLIWFVHLVSIDVHRHTDIGLLIIFFTQTTTKIIYFEPSKYTLYATHVGKLKGSMIKHFEHSKIKLKIPRQVIPKGLLLIINGKRVKLTYDMDI